MNDSGKPDRGRAFIQCISCVLSRLVAANDSVRVGSTSSDRAVALPPQPAPPHPLPQLPEHGVVTKFHALRPPTISIKDYLERCVCG